jgi:DNA-directed RNA polymerase III subunit RPC1
MAHQAKVLPWKTFRFNECCCAPYNADFDGDEMNIHFPQTWEARAEALTLMASIKNLATPKNGALLIAATQDFLTASFLLTKRNIFYDKADFVQIISFFSADGLIDFELPSPAILKPEELYTGKQVFSMLIRHSRKDSSINLEKKTKNYDQTAALGELDRTEGCVVIRNGELICGNLCKETLGGGKNNLFQLLLRDYSDEVAADKMGKLARLCARWIGYHGFSIGIDDVTPGPILKSRKEKLMEIGYADCKEKIEEFKKGGLQPDAGCSLDQTLESRLSAILSALREKMGKVCMEELPGNNSPLIMTQCGSKGSMVNISQMVSSVGQQTLSGHRIPNGFHQRTLPHFKKEDAKSPAAKGFVSNSFFSGLLPFEFFFHTMGGREGLIDTAVKTAETGYMQRRLMKALEDLCIQYDGTVRNSVNQVIQFVYGDDGIEPTYVEGDSDPLNYDRLLRNLLCRNFNPERTLTPSQILALFYAEEERNKEIRDFPISHKKDLVDFLSKPSILDDRLDEPVLLEFLRLVGTKMRRAIAEPGTAIGALCAQSIGEPCTQMTLKTFHFAGVASMDITQGVPRIRELMDATKNISTPFITAKLQNSFSEDFARKCKGQIERLYLGDIVDYLQEVYLPDGSVKLEIKIDWLLVSDLRVDVTVNSIIESIIADKSQGLKLKKTHIDIAEYGSDVISISPKSADAYFALQKIKSKISKIIIYGLPSVARCVMVNPEIKKDKAKADDKKEYHLLIEGSGLAAIFRVPGIDWAKSFCNHPLEMAEVLGIEAGRRVIIDEITYTMKQHNVGVDPRHVYLLADIMTYKGEILGITRNGIAKMKDSILMLASFEKTTDFLFNAGVYSIKENITGVSECIIMGKTVPVGTGLFSLLHATPPVQQMTKKTILSNRMNFSLSDLI